jgi:hypothetical protein
MIIYSKTRIWSLKTLETSGDKKYYQLVLSPSLSSWGLSEYHKKSLAFLLKDYYFSNSENEDFSIEIMDLDGKQLYQLFSVPNFGTLLLSKAWLEELIEFTKTKQWEEI